MNFVSRGLLTQTHMTYAYAGHNRFGSCRSRFQRDKKVFVLLSNNLMFYNCVDQHANLICPLL